MVILLTGEADYFYSYISVGLLNAGFQIEALWGFWKKCTSVVDSRSQGDVIVCYLDVIKVNIELNLEAKRL